jgi:TIR domain-containing protein
MASPRLRLVQPPGGGQHEPTTQSGFQQWLFPHDAPSLLIVFNTLSAKEDEFLYILEKSQPRSIVDFRPVPRFDFGTLDRQQVFERMSGAGTSYIDLHDLVPSVDSAEWDLASARAGLSTAFPPSKSLTGPLLCLVESTQIPLRRLYDLASLLPQESELGWDILLLPDQDTSFQYGAELDSKASPFGRKTIFISHANPEDNDFVLWLYNRLLRAGYTVWADLKDLSGGTTTWDEIEQQIRFAAAKVVVVLSKSSQSKQGVLDEVNLAISVERSRKLADFVVPIKLDDLPYVDVRANLARKNIINFSQGWSSALADLLNDLRKSGVKREAQDPSANNFAEQFVDARSSDVGVIAKEEIVDTNWLEILSLPPRLFFLEFPVRLSKDVFGLFQSDMLFFAYREFIGTFSSEAEILWPTGLPRPQRTITVDTEQLLKDGASGLMQIAPHEARRGIAGLLRKAWRQYASSLGLIEFAISNRRHIYAFPAGFAEADKAQFVEDGTKHSRKLAGKSEKRNVRWHLAVELVPRLSGVSRFAFKSHVLFSGDDGKFISDIARQHSLRRSFCRSWWNDRWRTLMLATLSWLSKDEISMAFPLGGSQKVLVSSRPQSAISPISLKGFEEIPKATQPDSVEEDEVPDFDDEGLDEVIEDSANLWRHPQN